MRKIIYIGCLLVSFLLMGGCKSNTYSKQLKAEKKLIANYIERKGIVLSDTLPDVTKPWPENVYVDLGALDSYDYLYFHLTQPGDSSQGEVELKDNVVLRYRKYTLVEEPDTINYWTTNDAPFPIDFLYGNSVPTNCCTAWMVAVKYMKYTRAECKIICPSKLGFDADQSDVVPYGYDIKIKLQKY